MSHVVLFKVSLVCRNCGSLNEADTIELYTSGLGRDSGNTHAWPGEELELEVSDFDDAFVRIRQVEDARTVSAVEMWGCMVCHRANLALLEFEWIDDEHWRFVRGAMVAVTRASTSEISFVSRKLEQYAPYPGDDEALLAALVEQSR